MEKYLQLTSGFILDKYRKAIENADYNLRHAYWKEGTKPQNKQLKFTQEATKELEDLYEDYLKPHIKVIRLLGIHCPSTTECINGIQELRKKGIISLLKKYNPQLGKNVVAPKTYEPAIPREEAWMDVKYGVYGRDWLWTSIGVTTGKCPIETLETYPHVLKSIDNKVVNSIGHARLNLQANQAKFEMLLGNLLKGKTPMSRKASDVEVEPAPRRKAKVPETPEASSGYAVYYGDTDPLQIPKPTTTTLSGFSNVPPPTKENPGIWEWEQLGGNTPKTSTAKADSNSAFGIDYKAYKEYVNTSAESFFKRVLKKDDKKSDDVDPDLIDETMDFR